jgi:transketolase
MSDGEVQEGQTWEAVQAASFHGIDNLYAIMDVNKQQCDGAMDSVMEVGDIKTKFQNFGAVCVEIDGHDINAMRDAVKEPHEGKPLIILANTNPFHSMSILEERFPRLHYVRFKSEDERARMNVSIAKDLGVEPIDYSH